MIVVMIVGMIVVMIVVMIIVFVRLPPTAPGLGLGGPYHWGGTGKPGTGIIYMDIGNESLAKFSGLIQFCDGGLSTTPLQETSP